ncbi:hypothetical protein PZF67_005270 [Pseudomonas aeruginosa]|uniref:hypothetical protein n=1 Tax=Pseudomonas aeruginosa TaxID=287 RepID=UPI00155E96C4|nr:hypothetical protein [Pseudomonas aeruginosa]EKW9640251.1 hypothetical protein [Pseudomonas aeruginosa]NRC33969.1 hypothetical protein [Pseudomonas aeruginosa]HDU2622450.1 hypothetical protein [Pseudomonas aeruginosa]
MARALTQSQHLALKYLESKCPDYVSPTEVGREVGKQMGKEKRHSSFGSPLCRKLVDLGLAVRNDAGHYAAATK